MLIVVVLNSQSDNSRILAASGSDACTVSSNCAFCLLVCLVILSLLVRRDALGKRNCCK